jgi:hypothetical protein
MDFLTAAKQIDEIAAHLLKLGCSETQVARHVLIFSAEARNSLEAS